MTIPRTTTILKRGATNSDGNMNTFTGYTSSNVFYHVAMKFSNKQRLYCIVHFRLMNPYLKYCLTAPYALMRYGLQ